MATLKINIITHNRPYTMALDLDPAFPNERTILRYLQAGKYYEPDVALFMLRAVNEGDVVIDVGANAGFFTVLLGTLAARSGRVLSFEPGDHNLERLRNNIATSDLSNVTVIPKAASNREEELSFYINSDDSGGNALWDVADFPGNVNSKANPQIVRMTATTLDAEIGRLGLPAPKLIKIDTEGAEKRVLEGARGLLTDRKVAFVVAELHEFGLAKMGSSQQDLRGFMEGFGYSTFALYFDGSMPKLIPAGTHITAPHIINLLFCTPEAIAAHWPIEYFNPAVKNRPES